MNICSIFIDLAKAFDTVNHDTPSYKLNQYGIRGLAFDLIKSYLQHRKRIVQVGNHSSSTSGISIGVPQSSVLGPIFFLIYIDDSTYSSDLKVTLYADDSVLSLANKNIDFLQKSLKLAKGRQMVKKQPAVSQYMLTKQVSFVYQK